VIRVVLDTNILISALLTPEGIPAQVVTLCLADANIQTCVSAEIYAEYEEVAQRPKFRRSEIEVSALLRTVRESSIWITPRCVVRSCLDPGDNIFLERAQEVEAHYLVTGNVKHFPTIWQRTHIVTGRQFLDAIY
jgi:putative PIN family toxin of toxin-antitoxin system